MIIELTKQQVAQAVAEEPLLNTGVWFKYAKETLLAPDPLIRDADVCSMCAVGAVLRRALHPEQSVAAMNIAAQCATSVNGMYDKVRPDNCCNTLEEAQQLVRAGACMSALSVFFEGTWMVEADKNMNMYGDEKLNIVQFVEHVRALTVAFVNDNFPDVVSVNIGKTTPA